MRKATVSHRCPPTSDAYRQQFTLPLVVLGEPRARALGGDGLPLQPHQLRVRREVRQRRSPEVLDAGEVVLRHELLRQNDGGLDVGDTGGGNQEKPEADFSPCVGKQPVM